MKKLIFMLVTTVLIFSLCGCQNENDCVEVWNRSGTAFDNITIKIKSDYFYDRHEKFTVDENTLGVTVYFTKEVEGEWGAKEGAE